jgi:hypothetical protein
VNAILAAAVALLAAEMPRDDQRAEVERRAGAVVAACEAVAPMFRAGDDAGDAFVALCVVFAFREARYVEDAEGDWICERGRMRREPTRLSPEGWRRESFQCDPGWTLVPRAFGAWQTHIGQMRAGRRMCQAYGAPDRDLRALAKTYAGGACLFAASIVRHLDAVSAKWPRLRGVDRLASASSSYIVGWTRAGGRKGRSRARWAWAHAEVRP